MQRRSFFRHYSRIENFREINNALTAALMHLPTFSCRIVSEMQVFCFPRHVVKSLKSMYFS